MKMRAAIPTAPNLTSKPRADCRGLGVLPPLLAEKADLQRV